MQSWICDLDVSDRPGLTKVFSLRDHLVARDGVLSDRVLCLYCHANRTAETVFGVVQTLPDKGFERVSVAAASGIATV